MSWLYLPSPYHENDVGAKKRSRRKRETSAELATILPTQSTRNYAIPAEYKITGFCRFHRGLAADGVAGYESF